MKRPQLIKLHDLLKDGEPHRTDEIMRVVYGSEHLGIARISARVWDVQKRFNVVVSSWRDPNKHSLYWYKIEGTVGVHFPAPFATRADIEKRTDLKLPAPTLPPAFK